MFSGVAGGGTSSAQRAVELRTEPDEEIDAGGTREGCVWALNERTGVPSRSEGPGQAVALLDLARAS